MYSRLGIIIGMVSSILNVYSQNRYQMGVSGGNCQCDILFMNKVKNPKGIIIIESIVENIVEFAERNEFVYSNYYAEYNFIYFFSKNLGSAKKDDCVEMMIEQFTLSDVNHDRKSEMIYYIDKINGTYVLKNKTSKTIGLNRIKESTTSINELRVVMDSLAGKTIFQTVKDYTSPEDRMMKNYKRNFDLGFFISPQLFFDNSIVSEKSVVMTYGFYLMKNISKRSAIKFQTNFHIALPSQSSIQSGLQSKIMKAIQNAESSILVDETMTGNVLVNGELSYRNYFLSKNHVRYFVTGGVGLGFIMNAKINLKDTIDISGVDMSSPSSIQSVLGDQLNPDESAAGNGFQGGAVRNVSLELGAELRMAPAVKLNLSIPFRYYFSSDGDSKRSYSPSLNIGLSFVLNPKKLSKF